MLLHYKLIDTSLQKSIILSSKTKNTILIKFKKITVITKMILYSIVFIIQITINWNCRIRFHVLDRTVDLPTKNA